jgi:hypothetical protein
LQECPQQLQPRREWKAIVVDCATHEPHQGRVLLVAQFRSAWLAD